MAFNKSSEQFSINCDQLYSILHLDEPNTGNLNSIIDELNAKPYKSHLFVKENDAVTLIETLCSSIKTTDVTLSAKTSHLMNNIISKQNIKFANESLHKVIFWHVGCLKICSHVILPDILHNLQCILQVNPTCITNAGLKFLNDLIGRQGLLLNFLNLNESEIKESHLQIHLLTLKCILSLITAIEDENLEDDSNMLIDIKDHVSDTLVTYLMKGFKTSDDLLYSKVVIAALRILTHIYFSNQNINVLLPDVIGISRYFMLFGLINNQHKPERILPAQQTLALTPVKPVSKSGKKQKMRKQRNNAIECLKKEIPVSNRSLIKDVDSFENNFAYKPASNNYLEPPKTNTFWTLTSDSDMSDVENSREAKLNGLKSRVRQSAANLLLVILKIKDKREIFGYWWALLPFSPEPCNWLADDNSKRSLAYCAVTDPMASSRASALRVILALLSGSKLYLAQAEISKKPTASFIPFSVTLGYVINCMHKILIGILDCERSHAVIIAALKCCAALVQATPYNKMNEGLINNLVRSTRKFLVHRDITLQVGALITMGCVLSIDPKVDEVLTAIQKDTPCKLIKPIEKENKTPNEDCDDFEEGYSDDEMFTASNVVPGHNGILDNVRCFDTWILDICFKNLGWMFKGEEIIRCNPSTIPVMLESLQVLSAIAFHHLAEVLKPHTMLLPDVLCEILQHEHQDIVFQAAKLISVIGDAIQKLEITSAAPPLNHCVYMWERLLTPLSLVLQNHESSLSKSVVCDCIANIGENSFKQLPDRLQRLCCALLMGSCSDEEASVRAAAVRALAMTVMYRTLREDICFVSDCGENILRALVESSVVVRSKAAWALGNLSDALVLNMDEPDLERIDDDLLLRLFEASVLCASDNDKVKMSATRGLGNLLRIIRSENITRYPQLKPLCESAIKKLLECACKVTNMKVRWNACYALGNALKNDCLYTCFNGWQCEVFTSLCTLAQDCKNLKVRINAAVALRAPATRTQYADMYVSIWRGILEAMDNAANVDDFTEYKHKDNLIEQLCVSLAHICCILRQSDLADILDPLVFHFDCAKGLFSQLYHKLPPEKPSCMKILQAAKYVTVDLTASNDTQSQSLGMLQEIFIWDM